MESYQSNQPFDSSSAVDVERYQRFNRTVFPALLSSSLSLNLSQIQLVWDFHTVSQSSLMKPLQDVYNSTLERVKQQLSLSDEDILSDLNGSPFPFNDASSKGLGKGRKDELYRKTKISYASCKNAGTHDMASRVYYRISVPWYLNSLKVNSKP